MRAPVAFGPLRIAAVAALLTVAAASSSAAGDRCLSHFPELRAFVDLAGTRGTPDEDTAAALADELAVERALWADEANHNRQRLAAAGAGAGLDRLDAVDAELGTLFDTFEAMLSGRGPLDEVVVDRLLECGGAGGPRWPIRSGSAPLPEAPPEHRRPRLAEAPPASYHEPPGGALRSAVKAAPEQVWPEDPLDPVVVKAAELGHDPVALYRFVLNGVRAEAYVGTLKSPAVVLASGGGNDADQAALLAELLRASGYPARIAWGVVEVPTSRLLRHFNVADPAALEALLTTVGIAWEPVAVGGQPAAYRIERFWCELWIPYGNFRGLELDGSGETWAVLDPTLESRGPPGARRVLDEIGLDPEVFLDDYLSGGLCGPDLLVPSACPDPRTLVETQVDQYLAGINDPESYASLAAAPAAEADELPILAASMPGHVVSVSWVGLEPPAEWRHRLHLRATAGGSVLLDATVDLAAITGREAALWYEPATEDDEAIVRAFDGDLWQVPPYLVNVTPTLIRRGGEVARGIAGIGMGRAFELEATVISPSGSTVGFANHEVAGAPTILAPAAGATGYRVLGDEPGSSLELLSALADEHMSRSRRFAEELAVLAGLGVGFPLPTVAFLGNEVEVDGALGLIQSLDWRGLVVDVDVWGPRAAGGTADDRRAWRTLAQLDASVSERAIFEDAGVLSVSADLALVRAERLGVQVVRIDQANLASVLPTLPYEQPILAEIEGWVLAGGEALVPAQPVALQTWNGVGYLLVDPATGGARYQLAGALSGGSTAAPPDQVVQEFGLELWPPTRHPVNPDPASVVALRKLEGFDGAEGTVGETLATELRVEAVDVHGARVAGVPVRFTSVAGGGSLLDAAGAAHQELWVATDDHGIAAAGFRLGTDTGANPVYALLEPDDEHATRALLHLVDAVGQGVDGGGGTIELPIPEPFWAAAFPGEPVLLRRTDTTATHFHGLVAQWSDTIFVAVEDGYGNPVSNVPVTFQVGPMNLEAACSNELPEPERVNAAVFDNSSSGGQPACGGHPVLGSCGGPTLTRQTSFLGTTAGVIEGNVVAATYFVEVGAPGLDPLAFSYGHSWTIDGTNQACDTPDRLRISSLYLTDELGRNVNAAPAGQAFDWPVDFWIEAYVALPRPGDPPFYAAGQWLPACAGDLSLQVDNGGVPSAPVLDPADWSYRTTVTTGALPGLNQVTATASALSFCATGEPIDAALFADVNRVWGLSAEVTGFQPPIALLTGDGRLGEPLEVGYAVEPAAYHALSVDVEVLDKDAFASTVWPGTSRSGAGSATLPRGEPVEIEHDYAATVVVNRSHPAQVTSPEVALPLHQPIFADVTRFLRVSQELDVVNRTTCADHDVFSFHLNHPATVTLTVVRDTPTGPAPPEVLIHEMPLAEGDHAFSVSPASATAADLTLLPGSYTFALHGVSQVVGHDETVHGFAISFFSMRDSLPVGHAMVKGVDLFDGHLVISREDLAVPGRGVPLGFERSYSSASAEPGHLGQGWTHSWLAR
ncbi:MAG TPA: DUF6531 domain-containing protein, partial [Candidatus Sulfomarinibacteraceae bacterium]|nr:DUF6531 domain-containing protein [Candidatus Sulfomarinibacteraceae bacterium]